MDDFELETVKKSIFYCHHESKLSQFAPELVYEIRMATAKGYVCMAVLFDGWVIWDKEVSGDITPEEVLLEAGVIIGRHYDKLLETGLYQNHI